ncbi:hypothetical protein AB0H73_36190 [Streptomyces olivoreticuli]
MTTTDENSQQFGDWWDRLYAEADTAAAAPAPPPRAAADRIRGRLPEWWEKKPEDLTAAEDTAPVEDEGLEEPGADDTPELATDNAEPAPGDWFATQPGYWPTVPDVPRPALSEGTKRLLYNVSAAGAGWFFGLTPAIGSAIEDCGTSTSIGGALFLGAGICLATAAIWDRRTRHWYRPLAWIARIPLMSAITALALYAPASQI